MIKCLLVAATKMEIAPILNHFQAIAMINERVYVSSINAHLKIIITGVGMVNTAYYMGKYLGDEEDYVINVGIAGAFNKSLAIGEVVNVTSDTLSEMGAEDGNTFIKFSDLGLGGNNFFKNQIQTNNSTINKLKKTSGITVNTIHGNEQSIKQTIASYNADVESMEGAAFFRCCQNLTKNYVQLRAISNYVERRDKSKWNIPLAIATLNDFTISLLEELTQ